MPKVLCFLCIVGLVSFQAVNCTPEKPSEESASETATEVVVDAATEPKAEPLPDAPTPEEVAVIEAKPEAQAEAPPTEVAPDKAPVSGPPKLSSAELLPGSSLANVLVDSKGNTVLAGSHVKGASFAGVTFAEAGFHVIKRDTEGKVLWSVTAEGADISQVAVRGLVADKAEQMTLIGEYKGKISLAGEVVAGQDDDNSFVLRLDTTGKVVWFKLVKKALFGEHLWGIALDSTGAAIITGHCQFNCIFGATTLKPVGKSDMYLAKMDDKGEFVWAVSGGGAAEDEGRSLTIDAADHIYLTGIFDGDATFGTTTLKARFAGDTFVAKFDKDGKYLWVQAPTHMLKGSEIRSIEISAKGSLYMAGNYRGFLPFLVAETDKSPETSVRPFVAKLDTEGKPIWVKSIQGGSSSSRGGVLDQEEHFYLVGAFKDKLLEGKLALDSAGKFDAFVVKYDPAGEIVWSLALGPDKEIFAESISHVAGGDLFVTASFFDSFKIGPFSIQVPASGSGYFLARLGQ